MSGYEITAFIVLMSGFAGVIYSYGRLAEQVSSLSKRLYRVECNLDKLVNSRLFKEAKGR